MNGSAWTDERVERLKKLWADGWSCSQIAADLGGVSRSSIIGKVHRLGLPGRVQQTSCKKGEKRVRKPRKAPPHLWRQIGPPPETLTSDVPTQPVEAVMEIPTGPTCSILDLTSEACRWPYGNPAKEEVRYCGAKLVPGLPYCLCHCRMAYRPVQAQPGPSKQWQRWRAA